MKYRDDIDPATTWVVSDSHWGHQNIIDFCHRPPDHEQIMMEEWARTVPDEDTVLHLGDLSYKNNTFFKRMIAPHLNGERKLLIAGNHDRQRYGFYRDCGFKIVKPFKIQYSAKPVLICLECCGKGKTWMNTKCVQCLGTGYEDTPKYDVSFSHYPWNAVEEGPMPQDHVRVHGHIHNNGYTRAAYVPFLLNHINMSAEQTHYRPVNLKALLDGALFGDYEQDQHQLDAEAALEIKKNAHVNEV